MLKSSKSDELCAMLRQRIASMEDGAPFPTVRQLMAEYGVSQSTVTPAINLLKEKGLLKAYVGRGSFVCRKKAAPRLLLLQNNWPAKIFQLMADSLREGAEANGFEFAHELYDYHEDITQSLANYDADIIILDGIANDLLTPEQILAISRSPAPVILSRNAVPVKQINYVCGDNSAAGSNIANYLINMGHRKLGFLINEPHLYTIETYRRGFESCARAHGCKVTVLDCEMQPGDRPDQQIEKFIEEYAAGKYDFTALFPVSCNGAVIARKFLDRHGIRVPQDLSLISSGCETGIDWLTIVDTGIDEYKVLIPRMALDILNHKTKISRQIEFTQRLLERKSVRALKSPETSTRKTISMTVVN
ncbi:GntR family transcriptional regulator [uncultured Victivallis sp.]|uniref:GntR family transcriptional regulator n=1 Tax=uncultured Victivallis sp. TaxID=354118 RepID=UPI0025FBC64B|nr:GntR family transcriptional regulator [uncultured Victivallis sp.]